MEKGFSNVASEQPQPKQVFEYYYALGEKQSYRKGAGEFNVSTSTVKLWGKSFRWKERLNRQLSGLKRPSSNR